MCESSSQTSRSSKERSTRRSRIAVTATCLRSVPSRARLGRVHSALGDVVRTDEGDEIVIMDQPAV